MDARLSTQPVSTISPTPPPSAPTAPLHKARRLIPYIALAGAILFFVIIIIFARPTHRTKNVTIQTPQEKMDVDLSCDFFFAIEELFPLQTGTESCGYAVAAALLNIATEIGARSDKVLFCDSLLEKEFGKKPPLSFSDIQHVLLPHAIETRAFKLPPSVLSTLLTSPSISNNFAAAAAVVPFCACHRHTAQYSSCLRSSEWALFFKT